MSESLAAVVFAVVGVIVLCTASVVLAFKTLGNQSIVWRGFGVEFRVSPCATCPNRQKSHVDASVED